MGEAGPSLFFVAGADMIPGVHRDRWRGTIHMENDVKSVLQSELFVGYAKAHLLGNGDLNGKKEQKKGAVHGSSFLDWLSLADKAF